MIKRIAVATTGGDAPGMNAAIRAVVRYAIHRKVEVMGVFRGWWGFINDEMKLLDRRSVSNTINQGGTILKTARCPQFFTPQGQERVYETIRKNNIDGLILIGGNGTFTGAHALYEKYKIPCVGVPGSIDNDINGIDVTFGSDTAINTALNAIDNIRDTATSLERIFIVEVMGRDSGYIALQVALAGGCEDVIIPEQPFDLNKMCHRIVEGNIRGKVSWIIVLAEGVARAEDIAKQITDITSLETRSVVLGHIQRGGRPTAASRILATTLGEAAVESLLNNETDKAVSIKDGLIVTIEFAQAIKKKEWEVQKLYNLIQVIT
ncbi:MAG: 6-phosphofructokinase [Candidatus Omnitrophota bacterium]